MLPSCDANSVVFCFCFFCFFLKHTRASHNNYANKILAFPFLLFFFSSSPFPCFFSASLFFSFSWTAAGTTYARSTPLSCSFTVTQRTTSRLPEEQLHGYPKNNFGVIRSANISLTHQQTTRFLPELSPIRRKPLRKTLLTES